MTPYEPPVAREPHALRSVCVCGRPARGLCRDCRGVLRRQLVELPGLWRELRTAEVRLTRLGERSTGHGTGGERGLPFNEPAGVHANRIQDELSGLAQQVQGGRWRALHPAVASAVILAGLGRLLGRPDVVGVAQLVGGLHQTAVRLVDIPEVRQRFEVGPCPETTAEEGQLEHCVGDVWAWIPSDEQVRPVLQCNTCETRWTPEQWARLGGRIRVEAERRAAIRLRAEAVIGGVA